MSVHHLSCSLFHSALLLSNPSSSCFKARTVVKIYSVAKCTCCSKNRLHESHFPKYCKQKRCSRSSREDNMRLDGRCSVGVSLCLDAFWEQLIFKPPHVFFTALLPLRSVNRLFMPPVTCGLILFSRRWNVSPSWKSRLALGQRQKYSGTNDWEKHPSKLSINEVLVLEQIKNL